VLFESGKDLLVVCDYLSLQGEPLGVALAQFSNNRHRFMVMLVILALDTVELLVFHIRTLTLILEADVDGLEVAIAVAHLHFFQLKKVGVG